MDYSKGTRILLLGVGNILFGDEGLGVHAVKYLTENYVFSQPVTLMDGGVLGKLLMPHLLETDFAIIMDAVLGKQAPGSIYLLKNEDLRSSLGFHDSQHQVDLMDILISCELLGKKPQTIIVGMEPENWKDLTLELSVSVKSQFEKYIATVLNELSKLGATFQPKMMDENLGKLSSGDVL